ncbi:MAG TPA: heavy metal-binding domain-containing protein [Methanobacterium sp.]|nr:heavy metal-binding domain-containing protein [Methanobacterium sp.]
MMVASLKKFFIEKRWALIAILLGIFWGFGSAVICIAWNLVIFGFNIMYIVSPLLAGFVETVIAIRRYGKSTGAISALLTFILINAYGWFSPGFLFPKEPVRLSLITIIAIILTLQAAFPTFMNYVLFVTSVGIFKKFIGFLVYIPSKILRRSPKAEVKEEILTEPPVFDTFLDELTAPLLSVPPVEGRKIKKYIGLVTGLSIAEEKETEGKLSMLKKMIEPTLLDDIYLGEARKLAISRMLEEAKSIGANNVVDVLVDYVSMGGLQGSALIVTATGTAVIVQGETSDLEKNKSEKGPMSRTVDENKVSEATQNVSGDSRNTSKMDEKINFSGVKRTKFDVNKRKVVEQIIGKEVINSSGMVVGKVKDVEVNWDYNEIEAIVLGKGSISESLGLSKEEIIIPYGEVEKFGDKILIKKNNRDTDSDYYSYLKRKIKDIE